MTFDLIVQLIGLAFCAIVAVAVTADWFRDKNPHVERQRPERAEDLDIANTPMRFRGERVVGPESRSRVGS